MINCESMSRRTVAVKCQPRDFALLRDLFVSRIMTLAHVAALHFDGRGEAAKKRVQKLKAAGFIAERARRAWEPGILFLTKRGFDLLTTGGHLSEYPRLSATTFERRARVSDLTLRHELEVMDAKAALAPAISRISGMTVVEFNTWPILCQFDVQPRGRPRVRVKPDGLIRVEERTPGGEVYEHSFFLEIDRGTETLDTLALRSICYREHYSSGGFAASFGASRTAYTEYPFRVLMVFPSEERRNNLTERLLAVNPPIETLIWLTTVTDLATDALGPVWIRPRDYRAAFEGDDVALFRKRTNNKRRPERERLVRDKIEYSVLFKT